MVLAPCRKVAHAPMLHASMHTSVCNAWQEAWAFARACGLPPASQQCHNTFQQWHMPDGCICHVMVHMTLMVYMMQQLYPQHSMSENNIRHE